MYKICCSVWDNIQELYILPNEICHKWHYVCVKCNGFHYILHVCAINACELISIYGIHNTKTASLVVRRSSFFSLACWVNWFWWSPVPPLPLYEIQPCLSSAKTARRLTTDGLVTVPAHGRSATAEPLGPRPATNGQG